MNIYISGISGTGMGPLALMAHDAGLTVCGSDLKKGAIYDELIEAGIEVEIGEQSGEFLRVKLEEGVDWFVHTSALPEDHAELKLARESGIKVTKRDDFTAFLIEKLGLKMVAVAGTHGKTTTTAMIVWAALKLGLPVSYIVGTTLGFAPSGAYHSGDKFFVYEADEYDRNFLKFYPWLAEIPAVSYDHPDIYPTREDYESAFFEFRKQSENAIEYVANGIMNNGQKSDLFTVDDFKLAGAARRVDAALAAEAVYMMVQKNGVKENSSYDFHGLIDILNEFPGIGRRFERIMDGLYSDYAHHPDEIKATIDVAKDEARLRGKKGIVVVYQPHQNTRQHEVRDEYPDAFCGAEKVLWLPTYLTREDPSLPVISAEEFVTQLDGIDAEAVLLNDDLKMQIRKFLDGGLLVVLMTAGPADEWLRENFAK